MRLIEHGRQFHPRIGELESFAMTKLRFREGHARDAVDGFRLDRDQVHGIELVGNFEQNAVMMFCASGGRERGPGGILPCYGELGGVFSFRSEPARNMLDEGLFGQRSVEQAFEFGGESGTVQRGGLIGGDAADRFVMNKLALDGE